MNKKEQMAFDAAIRAARIAGAFYRTQEIKPDIPIPDWKDGLVKGWLFSTYDRGKVERACSNSVHHSFGNNDKTTTQNPKPLYSSKLLALRAMRYEMEKKFAEILADIDERIAKEQE